MSKLEVDKITPQSGTTLTIGDSGDTIVIDSTSVSGAKLAAPTLVGSASSAGSILFKEDTDNGTNAVTLIGPAATADVTLNLPAANDTIVGRATTDTLTNKTINGSQIINSTLALDKLANGTDGNIISYDANGAIVAVATGSAAQVLTSAGAGQPPAFATATVPDDAITLAKMAPGTDGNIISYDASGNPVAVATGNDGQVLTSAGAGAPPVFETLPVGGITMADQWRITASATGLSGASDKISSNWERTDAPSGYGTIGSAMSQSSGTFTFPTTGIYLIMYKINGKSTTGSNNRYANGNLYTTTDNSSYAIAARGAGSGSGNLWDFETTAIFIFDVTNTSTHKVQMGYEFEASTSIYGGTNDSQTCVTFIRLGDT